MRWKYLIMQAAFGLFALALCSLMPSTLRGQYFGRNKVQYDNFKFKILKTKHFNIYFYPKEQEAAKQAARMAERWFARHTFILQDTLHGRQPLILYASFPQFKQTNAISGPIGEGTGGVTEALKRRIVLPFAGPLSETDHVIGHELVHAFQYDITGQGGGSYRAPVALRLPLWFIEGMAEFLSIGPVDPHTAMWIRDAAKFQKRLPSLLDLENPNFFPYRWGQALLAYVAGRWGDGTIGDLLKQAGRSGDIYAAIQQVLGITADSLAKDWHKDIHRVYDPIMKLTESPDRYGKRLITKEKEGGAINVGPVLSPDGSQMIFFSERNLFSIDLFLADATSGKIVRKISASELDPHYESLEFIRSAGTWSPDGKSIALAIITKGKPALSLLQVEQNKVTR
ncbi:MAG: peptidase S9, partial [Calditrichaeota bacterium]